METPIVLAEFVDACKLAIKGDSPREVIHVAMKQLLVDPAALAQQIPAFADNEIDTSERGWRLGGEQVLHQGPDLTVMVLDTLPGVIQPPHDHNLAVFIGVVEGCEEQRFWRRTSDGVAPTAGRRLRAGEIMALGTRAIHAISAPHGQAARAIHVYLGDIYDVERSVFEPESMTEFAMTSDRYDEFCTAAT